MTLLLFLNGVILTLTPYGVTGGQTGKVAMFGINLKVLKRSDRFYNLNEAYSSPILTPPLNGVIGC